MAVGRKMQEVIFKSWIAIAEISIMLRNWKLRELYCCRSTSKVDR